MRISDLLRVKGTRAITVPPDMTVRRLLGVLAEHQIGAVVVSVNGTSVEGIASERDIVRALAQRGAAVLSEPERATLRDRGLGRRLRTTRWRSREGDRRREEEARAARRDRDCRDVAGDDRRCCRRPAAASAAAERDRRGQQGSRSRQP